MNEEQIKAILSVRPANKLDMVSYEYLEELSINQATKIYVLEQENKELIEILKTIKHDINFAELCDGYLIEDKLNELEGDKND